MITWLKRLFGKPNIEDEVPSSKINENPYERLLGKLPVNRYFEHRYGSLGDLTLCVFHIDYRQIDNWEHLKEKIENNMKWLLEFSGAMTIDFVTKEDQQLIDAANDDSYYHTDVPAVIFKFESSLEVRLFNILYISWLLYNDLIHSIHSSYFYTLENLVKLIETIKEDTFPHLLKKDLEINVQQVKLEWSRFPSFKYYKSIKLGITGGSDFELVIWRVLDERLKELYSSKRYIGVIPDKWLVSNMKVSLSNNNISIDIPHFGPSPLLFEEEVIKLIDAQITSQYFNLNEEHTYVHRNKIKEEN